MNKAFLISVLLLALGPCVLGQKTGAKVDPAQGVHDAFDRLIDGVKQVDAEKVMSVYEKSPNLLIFNNNGTATIGWDNVNANVASAYAKVSNVTLDITGLKINMLGTRAAYVTCKWKQSQEYDGAIETSAGRMTLVFRRIGRGWKVTHRHTSPDKPEPARPVFPSERDSEQ